MLEMTTMNNPVEDIDEPVILPEFHHSAGPDRPRPVR